MSTVAQDHRTRRPVVLVVGPFSARGGIATVCRQMVQGDLARRWRVVPFDNTKKTPPDRPLSVAVVAHATLLLQLTLTIIRHRPALVHIHTCSYITFYRSMLDILIARALCRPVILHIHGGRFHDFLAGLRGLKRALVAAHLRLTQRTIVLGERWRRCLRSFLPDERLLIVPNGVSVTDSEPGIPESELLTVVYVGDLSEGKAPEDLLRAVSRLPRALKPRVRVHLIGPGPAHRRAILEDIIAHRNLTHIVRLLGELSPAETRTHLRRADVFVLPSHAEGMSVALLEAMAAGLPSVVTGVGAVPEVVRDGREAFVIRPGEIGALAERLSQLLHDPALRRTMGRHARRRVVEAFSVGRFCSHVDRVWRENGIRTCA